jgi:alkylation response protein AidB-like acyl-CoA dehydrogenase
MAYTPSPMFAGDLHDSARRLAAELGQGQRGFRTAPPDAQGSDGWRQMLALGWQGVWIAETDGGFGGGLTDLAAIVEALAGQALGAPLIERAGVVPAVLGPFAHEATVRELLADHAAGHASICPVLSTALVFASPSPHTDRPERGADGRLRGRLRALDLTEPASHLLFAAHAADGSAELILTEAEPLMQRAVHYSSNDGRRCADLNLDGASLAQTRVVAREEVVNQALCAGQMAGTLLGCVQAVGTAASLVTLTIDYLNTRSQFGVALSSFQALRHRLVEMYVAYENAYGMARQLVTAHADTPQTLSDILAAKLYMNQVARQLGESAIQLHGGMGMSAETLAARLAVRAITGAFDHGDSAQCLDWLAAQTLAQAQA